MTPSRSHSAWEEVSPCVSEHVPALVTVVGMSPDWSALQ
jgi:hypothetical protein